MAETSSIPRAFIWRKLHSLTGLFLVLYLIEHLLVNSQAAFFIGDDGQGFIRSVNHIHDLPYLPFIEMFLLGVPILIHSYWGIVYLWTSNQNYYYKEEQKPLLSDNPRNRAYTWQRITSWVLFFGIIAHVIHMRFVEYPLSAAVGNQKFYVVRLVKDPGLATLASRLGFHLYERDEIQNSKAELNLLPIRESKDEAILEQRLHQQTKLLRSLEDPPLKPNEVVAVSDSFGMAELLIVRDTFKIPIMMVLYTIFVLSACYHAFNGLWTFMISWGITLSETSRRLTLKLATGLMVLVAFWGLSAIWISYWVNLKQ